MKQSIKESPLHTSKKPSSLVQSLISLNNIKGNTPRNI